MVASLKGPETDRYPDFRRAVAETWPGGFPADNEVACQKAFDRETREHPAELVIACARLHGARKTAAKTARRANDGGLMIKLPSNFLKSGDWKGYIPQAEELAASEAAAVTALGNVRRALGEGLFDLLKRAGMPEASLAQLDGIGHEPPAHFTIVRPFQRTLLDRYEPQIRRHTQADISFTLVPKAGAA